MRLGETPSLPFLPLTIHKPLVRLLAIVLLADNSGSFTPRAVCDKPALRAEVTKPMVLRLRIQLDSNRA